VFSLVNSAANVGSGPHLLLCAVLSIEISCRMALSSKPAARRCCGRMMGQTDGRTDTDRFIYPALHTMRAVSTSLRRSSWDHNIDAGRSLALAPAAIDRYLLLMLRQAIGL